MDPNHLEDLVLPSKGFKGKIKFKHAKIGGRFYNEQELRGLNEAIAEGNRRRKERQDQDYAWNERY